MDEERMRSLKEIERLLETLPDQMHGAVCWVIAHFDLARAMCRDCPFTKAELTAYQKDAKEKEDYLLLVLLCLCDELR